MTDINDSVTAAAPRATALRVALTLSASLVLITTGCGVGERADAAARQPGGAGAKNGVIPGEVVISPKPTNYAAAAVSSPATISGIVSLRAPLTPGAPMPTGDASAVCGTSAIPDESVQQQGTGMGGVVVWLEGVSGGKALPLERRLELESDKCRLLPRVQAAVVGSAVNVLGHDDLRQHLRFEAAGESKPRAAVLLGRDEQVIPTELPAKTPGLVAIRDLDHPWPRAYLAVFDHPYFAVTKPDGSFTIDGVPPGTYTLVAWHERTKKAEQKVTVGAGGAVKVELGRGGR
jgi:hypothetical protein